MNAAAVTGYSGTPLDKKLGVIDDQRTWRVDMPASVAAEVARNGTQPELLKTPSRDLDMAHLFLTRRTDLSRRLAQARRSLAPSGVIWVSWPKRASGIDTDITDHVIREEAFPLGLVDVKVCAVDEIWSGLKLVIRKSQRV